MIFQRLAKIFLRAFFSVVLDLEVKGLENIPTHGSFILAHNHMNWVDPVLATALVPRDILPMSKIENFFIPIFGLIIKLYGAYPVRRGEVDRKALSRSLDLLFKGYAILIAPEGTRGKDFRLKPAKDGLAYIALQSGAPIVPMAFTGSERFWSQIFKLRRTKTRAVIGEPFYLSRPEGNVNEEISREELRQMTKEVMYRLAMLLPPEYRGAYGDLSSASEKYVVPYKKVAQAA